MATMSALNSGRSRLTETWLCVPRPAGWSRQLWFSPAPKKGPVGQLAVLGDQATARLIGVLTEVVGPG